MTVMLGSTIVYDGYVDNIGTLKQEIFKNIGIFPHVQILTWNGIPLDDGRFPKYLEYTTTYLFLHLGLILQHGDGVRTNIGTKQITTPGGVSNIHLNLMCDNQTELLWE